MNSRILQTLERKGDIVQAAPQRHSTIRAAATNLSRKNADAAIVELLNEGLARLTLLCYERDATGILCNVDPATGRVIVPLPWGRNGYAKWGLTVSESIAFRRIMFTRCRVGLALFFYDRSRRAWYLNLADYKDGSAVIAQLKEWQISIGEYRAARSEMRIQ